MYYYDCTIIIVCCVRRSSVNGTLKLVNIKQHCDVSLRSALQTLDGIWAASNRYRVTLRRLHARPTRGSVLFVYYSIIVCSMHSRRSPTTRATMSNGRTRPATTTTTTRPGKLTFSQRPEPARTKSSKDVE